jgi:hypothetical protein
MAEYFVIDLKASRMAGVAMFYARNIKGRTRYLEDAGRFPEAIVNGDLDRFDNGLTSSAVLTDCITKLGLTVVPHGAMELNQLVPRGAA